MLTFLLCTFYLYKTLLNLIKFHLNMLNKYATQSTRHSKQSIIAFAINFASIDIHV